MVELPCACPFDGSAVELRVATMVSILKRAEYVKELKRCNDMVRGRRI